MKGRFRPGRGLVLMGLLIMAGAGDPVAIEAPVAESADVAASDPAEAGTALADTNTTEPLPVEVLREQAGAVRPLVTSNLARRFLDATADLPEIGTRVIHYNREKRDAITPEAAAASAPEDLEGYERTELDGGFYYFTRYGTPLAVVRALDLVAGAGLDRVDGAGIVDFGFGSIGHLRLLASLGARIVGVEVDPLLAALYREDDDTGEIARAAVAGPGAPGRLATLFGQFPAEAALVDRLGDEIGDGVDLFISKNTLKRGYIHPERDVEPGMLVHLGVDDETFVRAVHDLLVPGGLFMIYNLHPAPAGEDEPYIPWADGRCPFSRDLLERSGFDVVAFDADDTSAARATGAAFGWSDQMDLETDLFGTYTLLRRYVMDGESP